MTSNIVLKKWILAASASFSQVITFAELQVFGILFRSPCDRSHYLGGPLILEIPALSTCLVVEKDSWSAKAHILRLSWLPSLGRDRQGQHLVFVVEVAGRKMGMGVLGPLHSSHISLYIPM